MATNSTLQFSAKYSRLFVDDQKLNKEARRQLEANTEEDSETVKIFPYEEIRSKLAEAIEATQERVWVRDTSMIIKT